MLHVLCIETFSIILLHLIEIGNKTFFMILKEFFYFLSFDFFLLQPMEMEGGKNSF